MGNSAVLGHNCDLKNFYQSVRQHPRYPKNFKREQNGKKLLNVTNEDLLSELKKKGRRWKKVLDNGWDENGNQVSLHYNQDQDTGMIFDFDVHDGWSRMW